MKHRSRWLAIAAAVLVAMQLVRPSRLNPVVDPKLDIGARLAGAPSVASILDRSCNDCHSHNTVWAWYSNVAPVSWLIARDVSEGRRELNFSQWVSYSPEKSTKIATRICREITRGDMPPFQYSIVHQDAKLSQADVKALCDWSETLKASGAPGGVIKN